MARLRARHRPPTTRVASRARRCAPVHASRRHHTFTRVLPCYLPGEIESNRPSMGQLIFAHCKSSVGRPQNRTSSVTRQARHPGPAATDRRWRRHRTSMHVQLLASFSTDSLEFIFAVMFLGIDLVNVIVCVGCMMRREPEKRRRSSSSTMPRNAPDSAATQGDDSADDDNDDSDAGNVSRMPRVCLTGRSAVNAFRDIHDPLACDHVSRDGKLCCVAPPPSSAASEADRQKKARRHRSSLMAHVDYCRDSCSACLRELGMPVRIAVVCSVANDLGVDASAALAWPSGRSSIRVLCRSVALSRFFPSTLTTAQAFRWMLRSSS